MSTASNSQSRRLQPETSESHLIFSIVSVLFCLPLGVFAILSSVKVGIAKGMNNYALARQASNTALRLSLMAVFIGSNVMALVASLVLAIIYTA